MPGSNRTRSVGCSCLIDGKIMRLSLTILANIPARFCGGEAHRYSIFSFPTFFCLPTRFLNVDRGTERIVVSSTRAIYIWSSCFISVPTVFPFASSSRTRVSKDCLLLMKYFSINLYRLESEKSKGNNYFDRQINLHVFVN